MSKVILPGATIGIIGGGQLGRMIAIAAKEMGYFIAVLEPTPNGPCSQVADIEINTPYDDVSGLKRLFELSNVVTYEFENIPSETIEIVDGFGYLPQGFKPLKISQNRFIEKTTIEACGFKVSPYRKIQNKEELDEAVKEKGMKAILKTTTGGYDGKGQVIIHNENDKEKAYSLLDQECILEEFITFKKELSVIATRSTQDEVTVFPVSENIHINNILHKSIVPARVHDNIKQDAKNLAIQLIKKLDFVGTLAVELFLTQNDELIINEIAPRPHNTGHYTIEGCDTSQFEQHVRAICGLKLGSTMLKHPTVMVNILGQHMSILSNVVNNPQFQNIKLHIYGKKENKVNRKMGHVTFFNQNQDCLLEQVSNFLTNTEWIGE